MICCRPRKKHVRFVHIKISCGGKNRENRNETPHFGCWVGTGCRSVRIDRGEVCPVPPVLFDSNNPDHALLAIRKLPYSGDDKLTFIWLRATRFGQVDGTFTPFWEMHVGQFFTVKDWQGAGFEVTNMSAIFYIDPATGKLN